MALKKLPQHICDKLNDQHDEDVITQYLNTDVGLAILSYLNSIVRELHVSPDTTLNELVANAAQRSLVSKLISKAASLADQS